MARGRRREEQLEGWGGLGKGVEGRGQREWGREEESEEAQKERRGREKGGGRERGTATGGGGCASCCVGGSASSLARSRVLIIARDRVL